MGYRKRTAYISTEVDVDLDDFDIDDIIEYVEEQGYTVLKGKSATNMNDLDSRIWQLYLTYTSERGAGPEMDKELGEFFAEYYNKVSV
jgi:hypothetical protein